MKLKRAYELDAVADFSSSHDFVKLLLAGVRLLFIYTKPQYSTQFHWIPTLFQFTNYPKYQKNRYYIVCITVNWEVNQKIISRHELFNQLDCSFLGIKK